MVEAGTVNAAVVRNPARALGELAGGDSGGAGRDGESESRWFGDRGGVHAMNLGIPGRH
jgi:hypothetical protein